VLTLLMFVITGAALGACILERGLRPPRRLPPIRHLIVTSS
jgi:hypothetical protein